MDAYDRFLAALEAQGLKVASRRRGSATARCPSHEDHIPSLSVTADSGKVLVHCHAGCRVEDVVGALGLGMRDLYDETASSPPRARGLIETVYEYVDRDDQLLFEVVRYRPKAFRQRRPTADGSYEWNLHGVPRVLYHLPQVVAAVNAGATVYLVEGEKDADRLIKEGVTATTAPQGAGKWSAEYTEILRGARVIILPDNDTPGRHHARTVFNALRHADASVTALELPVEPGGDVSDWLDAGHHVHELAELAEITFPDEWLVEPISIRDLANIVNTQEWCVEPLLPEGRTVAIYSAAGAGKSLLGLEVATAVAAGRPVLQQSAGQPQHVIYVDFEMTELDLYERLLDLDYRFEDPNLETFFHYYLHPAYSPFDTDVGGREFLTDAVERWHPGLVVIDTTSKVTEGPENDADTFSRLHRFTIRPLKARAVTVLLLDHEGKDPKRGQRGSSAKIADVDVSWQLKETIRDHLRLTAKKRRVPWVAEMVALTRITDEYPVRHQLAEVVDTPEVREMVDTLDRLDIPTDQGRPTVRRLLAGHGIQVRDETLSAAIRLRKTARNSPPRQPPENLRGTGISEITEKPNETLVGNSGGNSAEQSSQDTWEQVCPPIGGTGSQSQDSDPFEIAISNLEDAGLEPQEELGVYAGDYCRCGHTVEHYTAAGFPYCDECGPPR